LRRFLPRNAFTPVLFFARATRFPPCLPSCESNVINARETGDSIKMFSRGSLRRDFSSAQDVGGGRRGGWKAPPFRLPCRFSDYRALISTSGQLDDNDDNDERRKGKSALGARERNCRGFAIHLVADCGFREFHRSIRLLLTLDSHPLTYLPPDFFPLPLPAPRRLIIGFHGRNLPEIPRRTAIAVSALYPRLRNYGQRSGLAPDSSLSLTLDLANSPVKIDRTSVQCGG